jgi:hypothetical protein
MDDRPHQPEPPPSPGSNPRRLFLHEKDWRVEVKLDSEREFCYMMAPGQDYYHRLRDGEIYLVRGDEKLCLACAERRGLLSFAARTLAELVRIPGPPVSEPSEPESEIPT